MKIIYHNFDSNLKYAPLFHKLVGNIYQPRRLLKLRLHYKRLSFPQMKLELIEMVQGMAKEHTHTNVSRYTSVPVLSVANLDCSKGN